MTTDAFTAETDDGEIAGTNVVYATARATSSSFDDISQNATIGQSLVATFYNVYAFFIRFATGAIPDDATVTGAVLYITADNDLSTTDFLVKVARLAWTPPLGPANQEANYDARLGGTAEGTLRDTASGWVANTEYSLAVDPAGINLGGDTSYVLRSSRDESNTAPTGNEYVLAYTANHATSGKRPRLEVTYTVPGGQPTTVRFGAVPFARLPGAGGARLGG